MATRMTWLKQGGCAAVILAVVAGCHHQYLDPRLHGQVRQSLPEAPSSDVLEVRFLAVQGFVIEHDGAAVMMPPLYSNPSLASVAAGNKPLPQIGGLVDRFLVPEWTRGGQATLVGDSP